MTGEMSREEVTRENFPLYFAAADMVEGATVQPFDQYQGPYIHVPGKGRYFLCEEEYWYGERNDEVSEAVAYWGQEYLLSGIFRDFVEHGGKPAKREPYVVYDDEEPPYCSCGEQHASIQTAEEGLCYDCFTRQAKELLTPWLGYKPCGMLVGKTSICLVPHGTEHSHD